MPPATILITGCNRGIGLEMIRQLLAHENFPKRIFGTCRQPLSSCTELKTLVDGSKGRVKIFECFDVTEYGKLEKLFAFLDGDEVVKKQGLNVLLNNAGVLVMEEFGAVKPETMRQSYEINTVAPIMLTQCLHPLLKRAADAVGGDGLSLSRAAIVNVSTRAASIGDIISEGAMAGLYPYRCSKAALNIASATMSVQLKKQGILVLVLHPGHVQTSLGGPMASTTPQESVACLFKVMAEAGAAQTGRFFHFKGQELPW